MIFSRSIHVFICLFFFSLKEDSNPVSLNFDAKEGDSIDKGVTQGHIDHIELKLLKKLPMRENPDLSVPVKQEMNLPCDRCPPCSGGLTDNLITS